MQVKWSVSSVQDHLFFAIERSVNGIDFEEIYTNNQPLGNGTSHAFNFTDRQLPSANVLYYRIKQCDIDGSCHYSDTKAVKILNKDLSIYPIPAFTNLNISFNAIEETTVSVSIINKMGQMVRKETKKVFSGANIIPISIQELPKGNYTISIDDGKNKRQEKFIKL